MSCQACLSGTSSGRGQLPVLRQQPDEAGDQRIAVRAAGIAAAIGGDGDQSRGLRDFVEGQREIVGRGRLVGAQAFDRLHQFGMGGIGVSLQRRGQAGILIGHRRVADADEIARIVLDHILQHRRRSHGLRGAVPARGPQRLACRTRAGRRRAATAAERSRTAARTWAWHDGILSLHEWPIHDNGGGVMPESTSISFPAPKKKPRVLPPGACFHLTLCSAGL